MMGMLLPSTDLKDQTIFQIEEKSNVTRILKSPYFTIH